MKSYGTLLAVVMLLAGGSARLLAEEGVGIIKSIDKAALDAAKDTTVTVEGKVSKAAWSKSGKVLNIEFDGPPNFVAAAFEKSREKLDAGFGGDVGKALTGATVRITGKLAAYGGKSPKYTDATQIVVSQTTQITIVTPAPTTAPTTAPTAEPVAP